MEYWDAFDEGGNKTGQLLERGKPVPDGLYHLVVNTFVQHEDGDWLFMKRSGQKNIHPNVFECGAGGSVLAGESSQEAALRELEEETGLTTQELRLVASTVDTPDHCLFDYYLARVEGEKDRILYQVGETDGHEWVATANLENFFSTHLHFKAQKTILENLVKDKNLL